MSDIGFTRPDLFSIPAAEQAELADAVRSLLSADGCPPAGNNPPAPLTRDVTRTLIEAGFTLHDYHRYDPLCRLGVVCLTPIPAESGTGRSGIAVSWTIHDLQLDWDWNSPCHNRQLVNTMPGSVLHSFGYLDRQRGRGGARLVTGHRSHLTEAGR